MYLQLADGSITTPPANFQEFYIWVPASDGSGGVWLREDQLDHLSDAELYMILQQQPTMSGIKDWFNRIRARKDARNEAKVNKINAKADRISRGEPSGFERVIGKVTDAASNIFGGGAQTTTMQPQPGMQQRLQLPVVTGGANVGVNQFADPKNLLIIAGLGIGAIVLVKALSNKKAA